uniref:Uncharacterized protein n=1 Tax=Oryza barthii TaxID=65489 RepID=A0A0D3G5Z5_9ORYZ
MWRQRRRRRQGIWGFRRRFRTRSRSLGFRHQIRKRRERRARSCHATLPAAACHGLVAGKLSLLPRARLTAGDGPLDAPLSLLLLPLLHVSYSADDGVEHADDCAVLVLHEARGRRDSREMREKTEERRKKMEKEGERWEKWYGSNFVKF